MRIGFRQIVVLMELGVVRDVLNDLLGRRSTRQCFVVSVEPSSDCEFIKIIKPVRVKSTDGAEMGQCADE